MNSNYIFKNKRYEIASRNVKAALFDIVTNENSKLLSLRDEIDKTEDKEEKERLESIGSSQRESVKSLIASTNQLMETIKKLDSYSKELNQQDEITSIEENEMIPVDESVFNSLDSDVNTTEEESKEENAVEEEKKENKVEDDSKEDIQKDDSKEVTKEEVSEEDDIDLPFGEPSEEEKKENIAEDDSIEDIQKDDSKEETNKEVTEEEKETSNEENKEEKSPEVTKKEVSEEDNDIDLPFGEPSEEEKKEEPKEESTEEEKKISSEENKEEKQPEENNEEVKEENEISKEPEEETSTGKLSEEEIIENYLKSINIPGFAQNTTTEQPAPVTPQESNESEEEKKEEAVIPPENKEEEKQPEENNEEAKENNSSLPTSYAEEEKEEVVIPPETTEEEKQSEETQEDNTNVEVPISTNEDSVETTEESGFANLLEKEEEEKAVFSKADTNNPRAILISTKQGNNLRSSRDVQTVLFYNLLNTGVLNSDSSINGNEDFASIQSQIETLMQQANNYYKEGKISEAQEIYEQISSLNKKLQTSGAVVK